MTVSADIQNAMQTYPDLPKGIGAYARKDGNAETACAAGFAFLGSGMTFEQVLEGGFDEAEVYPNIVDPIPWALLPEQYRQFHSAEKDPALLALIIELNDPPFAWSLDEIVAYLESIGR